jgi:ParB family transcriptional regulator, chromosome partitioning protein
MSAAKKNNDKPVAPLTLDKRTASSNVRKNKSHLGKGLGALISKPNGGVTTNEILPQKTDKAAAEPIHNSVIEIPAAEIERSPWQPRHNFDQEALRELADSIRSNGIIQPLICRRNAANRFELIAGERRLRASIAAGMQKVPVILVDAEDRRAAEMAIVENIQRQDLNVIEEAEGYRALANKFDLTQQEVADRVGKARTSVANTLRLLELPDEIKQMVSSDMLSTGHAKVLLSVPEPSEQILLGRKCIADSLTVRGLENLIKKRQTLFNTPPKRSAKPDLPDEYVHNLTDLLHNHFGTAVRLTPSITHSNGSHTKGIIEIDFYDNDDLNRILDVFGVSLD